MSDMDTENNNGNGIPAAVLIVATDETPSNQSDTIEGPPKKKAPVRKNAPAKTDAKKPGAKKAPSSRVIKKPNREPPKNPPKAKELALAKLSDAQRKKISDLEKKEKAAIQALAKQEGVLAQMKKKVVNIKWPVKDEQVLEFLKLAQDNGDRKRGAKKLCDEELQPGLPSPQIPILLTNQGLACDAISCWDFMTTFGNEMELNNMPLDHFTELLQFTGRDSPALVEVFTAPLRVVLADEALANRLSISLPLEKNFARKETAVEATLAALDIKQAFLDGDNKQINDSPGKKGSKTRREITNARRDFRSLLSLSSRMMHLPRELSAELLNEPLEWQEVLAGVFMYLPPVARLLRLNAELLQAVAEYEADIGTLKEVKVELSAAQQADSTEGDVGMDIDGDDAQPDSMNSNTPNKASGHASHSQRARQQGSGEDEEDDGQDPDGVNIDNILCLTGDIQAALTMCKESITALRSGELFTAKSEVKVFILKALFESCCDTQFFRELLAANHASIFEKRKEMREAISKENAKKREGSKEVTDLAKKLCREDNRVKLEAAEARKAALEARKEAATAKKKEKGEKDKVSKDANGGKPASPPKAAAKKPASPEKKAEEKDKASSSSSSSGSAKTKAGAKDKDPLDPSPNQLAVKVAELLLLKNNDVDEVRPSPPLDEVSDSEEEVEEPATDGNSNGQGVKRRKKTFSRKEAADREERRKNREHQIESIEIANERLEDSIEMGRERDLKRAIREAQEGAAKLRWYDKSAKKWFCTPILRNAFKALQEISEAALKVKQDMEMEEVLEEYVVRSEPLGYDRYFNEYYCFKGDRHRLYVRIRSEVPTSSLITVNTDRKGRAGNSNMPNIVLDLIEGNPGRWTDASKNALTKLYDMRPLKLSNPERATWGIYGGAREIYQLMEALDERGVREKALKYALSGKYGEFGGIDAEAPPTQYQYDHEWVGRRVKRVHKERHLKPSVGIIDGWLPEDEAEGDPALWHCKYKDGDEEELDLKEMNKFLIDTDQDNTYFIPPTAGEAARDTGSKKGDMPHTASSSSLTSSSSQKDISKDEKVVMEEEAATKGDSLADLPAPSKGGKKKEPAPGAARYSKPVDVQLYMQRYMVQDNQGETEDEDEEKDKEEKVMEKDRNGRSLSGRTIKSVRAFGREEEDEEARRAAESAMLKAQLEAKFRDEEPEVCNAYSNTERGYRHKPAQRDNIGLPALQRRLQAKLSLVQAALKNAGLQQNMTREIKGHLASTIDNAKTASELSSVVLELEAYLHQIQELDPNAKDQDDQKLAKENQANVVQRLLRHDWWLDPSDSPYIGKTVRRYFSRTGGSNGVVMAAWSKYARHNNRIGKSLSSVDVKEEEQKEKKAQKGRKPAAPIELDDDEADESAKYMIEHEDGEWETVDEATLLSAIDNFETFKAGGEDEAHFFSFFEDEDVNADNAESYRDELNTQKVDMLWPVKHKIIASAEDRKRRTVAESNRRSKKGSKGVSKASRSRLARDDDSTESEDDEEEEMDVVTTKTIWPTAGVRSRWQEGARTATTVAGVALALSTLMAASEAFGAVDEPDETY